MSKGEKRLRIVEFAIGIVFLVVGCAIYLLFRSKSLNIYQWCYSLGLSDIIDTFRNSVQECKLSDFVKYSLPDGLYCAAYILIIDSIWFRDSGIRKNTIVLIVPFVTTCSEILQHYGLVRGTFDVNDLICYVTPPLVYYSFKYCLTIKSKKMKTKIMYMLTIAVIALFAIGFGASDDSEESKNSISEEQIPINMESVTVDEMLKDLETNAMKAQKKYSGKWFEISGKLGSMDSEGSYFTLDDFGNDFFLIDVTCKLPKARRAELIDKLVNFEKGDGIFVKGKVIDMGEVMGYRVEIVDIDGGEQGKVTDRSEKMGYDVEIVDVDEDEKEEVIDMSEIMGYDVEIVDIDEDDGNY